MWIGVLFLIFLNDLNEEKEVEPTGGHEGQRRRDRDTINRPVPAQTRRVDQGRVLV